MIPADCFAKLPDLLSDDADLLRRGRWLNVECRIDIGSEPFHLTFKDGALAAFESDQAPGRMRPQGVHFFFRRSRRSWIAAAAVS